MDDDVVDVDPMDRGAATREPAGGAPADDDVVAGGPEGAGAPGGAGRSVAGFRGGHSRPPPRRAGGCSADAGRTARPIRPAPPRPRTVADLVAERERAAAERAAREADDG